MGQSQGRTTTATASQTNPLPPASESSSTPDARRGPERRKVLIIGAGSSGLVAIQEALAAGLEPVCFELRSGVGGAWRYDPDPGPCEWRIGDDGAAEPFTPGERDDRGKPPPTSMYASLRTNVPTPLMRFQEQAHPGSVNLFCTHNEVRQYLEDFAEPFLPYIRFDTRVVSVRHTLDTDPKDKSLNSVREEAPHRRWTASYRSTLDDDAPLDEQQFDAVFVASGHYYRPHVPATVGLKTFTGELLHSRWYRDAKRFEDKTVLVVGNWASGYDITRELAASVHARRQAGHPAEALPCVYQSARSPSILGTWEPPNAPEYAQEVQTFPAIQRVVGGTVEFVDGRTVSDVDAIIFATGFYFSYPFLSPASAPFSTHPVTYSSPKSPSAAPDLAPQPSAKGLRVHNLDDRMLFYLPDPTLAFLGVPFLIIPFPFAQIQARLAARHFASSPRLPAPLTFRSNPSTAGPAGEEDGAPETRHSLMVAYPKDFDLHDRMLQEAGDLHEDGSARDKQAWRLTSAVNRDLRVGTKDLRRAVLGY